MYYELLHQSKRAECNRLCNMMMAGVHMYVCSCMCLCICLSPSTVVCWCVGLLYLGQEVCTKVTCTRACWLRAATHSRAHDAFILLQ